MRRRVATGVERNGKIDHNRTAKKSPYRLCELECSRPCGTARYEQYGEFFFKKPELGDRNICCLDCGLRDPELHLDLCRLSKCQYYLENAMKAMRE